MGSQRSDQLTSWPLVVSVLGAFVGSAVAAALFAAGLVKDLPQATLMLALSAAFAGYGAGLLFPRLPRRWQPIIRDSWRIAIAATLVGGALLIACIALLAAPHSLISSSAQLPYDLIWWLLAALLVATGRRASRQAVIFLLMAVLFTVEYFARRDWISVPGALFFALGSFAAFYIALRHRTRASPPPGA